MRGVVSAVAIEHPANQNRTQPTSAAPIPGRIPRSLMYLSIVTGPQNRVSMSDLNTKYCKKKKDAWQTTGDRFSFLRQRGEVTPENRAGRSGVFRRVTETDDAYGRSGRRGVAPTPSYPAANASRGMHDRPRVSIPAPVAATLEQRKPRGGIAMEQAIVQASNPKSAAPCTTNRSPIRRLHPPSQAIFQGKDRT